MTLPPKTSARASLAKKTVAAGEAERERLRNGLPHLFGFKWYAWAKIFFDSTNRMNILCAANQISKSSTQIRKYIHWATSPKKWPELWPLRRPRQFWVLYPTKDVATAEWHTKIEPEFMPRNEFKTHPVYGWTVEFEKKQIFAIHFNSGITIYFKAYTQDVHALQSGTVDAIFCDEELPEELLSELQARLYASEGYFHMVFTATRNQLLWLQAIEGKGTEEKFPDACKMQISMFDCQVYLDGTPGHFTEEKIRLIRAGCRNKTEELRRVWGRFVRESGRCISEFNPLVHFIKPVKIPKDWLRYTAIDNGSGGDSGHPGAFSMLAVRPDLRLGYFYHCWRGDGIQTTAGDVIDKWVVDSEGTLYIQAIYDYASKDLATIAERQGIPLVKAEKSHELGEDVLNTLFKNNMLFLFDTPELRKMGVEFMTVMTEQPKRRRKDDLSDTARYVATAVPWDWSALQGKLTDEEMQERKDSREWTPQDQYAWEQRQRRGQKEPEEDGADELDAEFDFWNQAYGN